MMSTQLTSKTGPQYAALCVWVPPETDETSDELLQTWTRGLLRELAEAGVILREMIMADCRDGIMYFLFRVTDGKRAAAALYRKTEALQGAREVVFTDYDELIWRSLSATKASPVFAQLLLRCGIDFPPLNQGGI